MCPHQALRVWRSAFGVRRSAFVLVLVLVLVLMLMLMLMLMLEKRGLGWRSFGVLRPVGIAAA